MGIDLHLYALEDEEIDQRIGDYKYRGRPERAYVRESYGHEHYATEALVPETWEHPKFPETAYEGWQEGVYVIWGDEKEVGHFDEVQKFVPTGKKRYTDGHVIPARYLRARLEEACRIAEQRYNRQDWVDQHRKSFSSFVEAAEQIEREGKTVLIVNSY